MLTTTIQFYHLLSTSAARAVPKLMEKALAAKVNVVMMLRDDASLKQMSDALWSNNPAGFLPHGGPRDGHAAEQPIYLTLTQENPNNAQILCVLNDAQPDNISDYQKLLDVFDGADQAQVQQARARWAHYQSLGFALQYVKQQPGGGWKIEMSAEA